MIASLYQSSMKLSALGSQLSGRSAREPRADRREPLQEVLKIPLRPYLSPNPENVSRHNLRIQLHVIPWAMPSVARAREELVDLERAVRVEAQGIEVELDPAGLRIVRVDVDDGQDDVVSGGFAVAEDLVVRRVVERQRRILLQCRVLAADAVHARVHIGEVIAGG